MLKKLLKKLTRPIVNGVKGEVGEIKVDSQLNPLLFGRVYHKQINNLILIDEHNKSHQIDHVEIRENGIFCIETKNFIGWIFGNDVQDKWVQTLYTGEKHQFFNPIKQNRAHVYYLSKILGNEYHVNSIIVMAQNNADRIDVEYVVNIDDLKIYLKNYDDGTHLNENQINDVYNKLISANSHISNKEHLRNIENTQKELQEGICSRCGGKLVEREGKFGKFLGCSNYPNCRFTLNLRK